MGRVLGIDFGQKRIGLARSDASQIISLPFKTIQAAKSLELTVDLIIKELEDVESIVVGLPLLFSGKDSKTTEIVRKFAAILETKSTLPITLWDERLTTSQVERVLKEDKMSRKKRSKHLDVLSATLILQSYLDRSNNAC
ncbi:MAG: putative pre-16S rRNA nuclease [Chlamydiae bacterium]|nr:putative pre-16S rRNA nuclease [Chlamydiota bacterium]